jgi:hypothetical protein
MDRFGIRDDVLATFWDIGRSIYTAISVIYTSS